MSRERFQDKRFGEAAVVSERFRREEGSGKAQRGERLTVGRR